MLFQKKIQNVLLIYRSDSPEAMRVLGQLEKYFAKLHIKTQLFSQSTLDQQICADKVKADLVLVLGGDGTYLRAVQFVSDHSIPFLGINLGSLGFLTIYRQETMNDCLQSLIKGELKIEERTLIDIAVNKKSEAKSYKALNDLVIEKGSSSHLISLSIAIQGQDIYSFRGDGLIVSTPTGSTAYNLSAGGPILHPHVSSLAITPICSHSLTNRPVIVPDTYKMLVSINNNKKQKAFLTVDGRKMLEISNEYQVIISKSLSKHKTLRGVKHNDFLLLKDKLKFYQ